MTVPNFSRLRQLLDRYNDDTSLTALAASLQALGQQADDEASPAEYLRVFHQALPLLESRLWRDGMDDADIDHYQALFREMEQHQAQVCAAATCEDNRHEFVIVIPVADRPQHLEECLHSICELCELYGYGGKNRGYFSKVSVLVADDSMQPEHIDRHQRIARDYDARGLRVIYFGEREQREQVASLSADERHRLRGVIGDPEQQGFRHKGASITRNITSLRLMQLARHKHNALFYFIDSDQEFRVRLCQGDEGIHRDVYALNYFYHLDRIFSSTGVRVLSGKVVGDPPVSPAVMASNFLDDLVAFFGEMAGYTGDQSCRFHGALSVGDDASYHDMAELFGFRHAQQAFRFHCPLQGRHDHAACFAEFAANLNRFFDGEHPTRKTCFSYQGIASSLGPARTVYTGNYLITPESLEYFIPFAELRLRMAGPVLGRIIKAELAGDFVSAALPMLHKRTLESTGRAEYRPGIDHADARVDLSAEFERQFYGDVMLFSMEPLSQRQPPEDYDRQALRRLLAETEHRLREKYMATQREILHKLQVLQRLIDDSGQWWNHVAELQPAMADMQAFMHNMQHNYGEQAKAYRQINDEDNRRRRIDAMCEAILNYAEDRRAWTSLMQATLAAAE